MARARRPLSHHRETVREAKIASPPAGLSPAADLRPAPPRHALAVTFRTDAPCLIGERSRIFIHGPR
jgi:hypothetical protein